MKTYRNPENSWSGRVAIACYSIGLVLIVLSCNACASAPAPTAPPMPTPQVVTVPGPTVYVTPKVCVNALNELVAALGAENSILKTVANGGTVTQEQVDTFTSLNLDKTFADATSCRDSADVGS
jgi:hypothetical protein